MSSMFCVLVIFIIGCIVYHEHLQSKNREIKIVYHSDIDEIKMTDGGNWVDLRSASDVNLVAGESTLIPLGVAMKLPDGYEAIVAPRSSMFKNFSITQTNSFGVIDNNYSGTMDEWKLPVIAHKDTAIKKNDRICQFRIQKIQGAITFKKVTSLDEKNRGGFGSSGVK